MTVTAAHSSPTRAIVADASATRLRTFLICRVLAVRGGAGAAVFGWFEGPASEQACLPNQEGVRLALACAEGTVSACIDPCASGYGSGRIAAADHAGGDEEIASAERCRAFAHVRLWVELDGHALDVQLA